jgi:hypothetical protein
MTPAPEKRPNRQLGAELIIPVMALAFTAYYFATILDSPWTAQVNAFLVGSVLILTVLLLFVRISLELRREGAGLGFGDLLSPAGLLPQRAAFAALTLTYLILIEWVGFTLTTFAFLAGSMVLLSGGRRIARSLLMACLMALVGYVVFIAVFGTRLPSGPFENLMKAVF